MKLFIIGATGGTGLALVEQALSRGHEVTAFVRSPDKVPPRPGLSVRAGDPRSVDQLREALPGHDAVLSALGSPASAATTLLEDCARAVVDAMRDVGLRRLLVVSMAPLFRDAGLLAAFLRLVVLRHHARDSAGMERVVMGSGLDWTVVRPPRLTHGPLTQRYRAEDGRLPRGGSVISRADVAHFMLVEVERRAHVGRIVGVCQ